MSDEAVQFDIEHDPLDDEDEKPIKCSIRMCDIIATAWLSYEEAAELSMSLWDPIDEAAGEGRLPAELLGMEEDDDEQ